MKLDDDNSGNAMQKDSEKDISTISVDSHRCFHSNFSIGGEFSAFTGIVSPRSPEAMPKHVQYIPDVSPELKLQMDTPVFPAPTMFSRRTGIPTDLPIAPAFAQIFQRRRRRESRPRRQRTTFTSEQTLKLEMEYTRADYITRPRRFELAELLTLSENQIKIWFQNRRAKDKRIEKAHMDQQLRTLGYSNLQGSFPIAYQNMCGACAVPSMPLPLRVSTLPYSSAPNIPLKLL